MPLARAVAMMWRSIALQRADSQERFVVPNCPKTDVGRLKPCVVKGVCAARSRFRAGGGQMDIQEIDHARITEVASNDPHHAGFFRVPLLRITMNIARICSDCRSSRLGRSKS
jgi:hypothetical protein